MKINGKIKTGKSTKKKKERKKERSMRSEIFARPVLRRKKNGSGSRRSSYQKYSPGLILKKIYEQVTDKIRITLLKIVSINKGTPLH